MCIRDRVLKNSIIRFDLTNVPQEVGTLSHIDWTEETATGVFKSMTLHVTGVTFSATNSSLTAYLSFDPAAMKIIAGGKYMVALYGCLLYTSILHVKCGFAEKFISALALNGKNSSLDGSDTGC